MTSNNNFNPNAPLSGVRVVEVANFLAAPICSALMADMGADVIKIEPPAGDTTRNMRIRAGQPPVLNHGFHALNRGKRSITIDLKQPGSADVVIELVKNADVFVTNLMTIRLEKYGITYEKITENNPIVFAQVTGWGSQGEGASRPGFDSTSYWAGSGLMGILGDVDTPAVVSRGGQGDYPAGLVLLTGILAALRLKEQTGTAQFVDGTLQRAGLWSMALESQNVMNNPNYHPERYDRMTADLATRNCYQTSDGRWMMLTMHNILYWKKFCIALGKPEWAEDPHYVSSDLMPQNQSELIPEIDTIFRSQKLEYWAKKLDENGCVWAVAASLEEVTTDNELLEQGAFHTIPNIDASGNSVDVVSIPFSIDTADIKPSRGAPGLGEHSQSILLDAGFSENEISDIASKGILG